MDQTADDAAHAYDATEGRTRAINNCKRTQSSSSSTSAAVSDQKVRLMWCELQHPTGGTKSRENRSDQWEEEDKAEQTRRNQSGDNEAETNRCGEVRGTSGGKMNGNGQILHGRGETD